MKPNCSYPSFIVWYSNQVKRCQLGYTFLVGICESVSNLPIFARDHRENIQEVVSHRGIVNKCWVVRTALCSEAIFSLCVNTTLVLCRWGSLFWSTAPLQLSLRNLERFLLVFGHCWQRKSLSNLLRETTCLWSDLAWRLCKRIFSTRCLSPQCVTLVRIAISSETHWIAWALWFPHSSRFPAHDRFFSKTTTKVPRLCTSPASWYCSGYG